MPDKYYTVESTGAGRFEKGQTFEGGEYGEFLPKAIRTGGVREATAEEVKAYKEAQKTPGTAESEGLPIERSSALATGDIDAVSPEPEQPAEKKGK